MTILTNYRDVSDLVNLATTQDFDSGLAKIVTAPDFADDPAKKLTLSFITSGQNNVTKSIRDASFVCLKNVPRQSAVINPDDNSDEPTNFKTNCESHMIDGQTLYFMPGEIPTDIAQVFVGSSADALIDSWSETVFEGKTGYGGAKISFLVNASSNITNESKTWFIKATCKTKTNINITRITALVVKDDPIEHVELQSTLVDV